MDRSARMIQRMVEEFGATVGEGYTSATGEAVSWMGRAASEMRRGVLTQGLLDWESGKASGH